MLKFLRSKKTAKKIWITLAVVIIPAFCLWGIGSAVRGKKEAVFLGRVFGKSISVQEYMKNYKAVRNQYLIRLGQEQLARLEKYLNLQAQAWDRIVLLAEAKRRKINIGNKQVVDSIKQFPFFRSNDRFDSALYQELLTYAFRCTARSFEEEIRDSLIIARLFDKTTEDIRVDENEARDVYIKENEQISLDYISASSGDFLDKASIEEQELLDYYDKNPEAFRKPLSYNLEYIKVGINEKEVINKIKQSINQGSNLTAAAKASDLEVKQTGLFSNHEPIPDIGWSTEILEIIPRLEPAGKSWEQPIQGDEETVYFIALKEKQDAYIPAFGEVRDAAEEKLRQEKANQLAKEQLQACRQEAEASGFNKAAKEFNLKAEQTELFKRRGYVQGLGSSDLFFAAIQNLGENQISKILSIPSGFCIVKLKERIQPPEEEFQEKKEEFTNKLLNEKKQSHFNNFLTELKKRPNTFLKSLSQSSP